jgi:5'-3' exonuclease
MTERLFDLDGPGFLFRAYHAIPFLSTSKGVPSHAVFGMSTMLWKLLREDNPEYFAVAWDPPGPTFREEKFAAYKETRAPTPDDLRTQIPLVKTLFEALRLPLLEVPGFEADDVLGTVVDRTRDLPIELVLVTSDKDMLQLVSPRVRVFSTTGRGGDRVVFDEAAVKAKWGVEPAQIPDILALMGDSIDNIPGVPGVGEKTAAKLIGQFGGVTRLYENLSLVPGKLRETLAANRKQALLSRELATVSTRVPIAVDLEAFRRREPDWERLRALWTELEFHSLLRQLPAEPAPEATGGEVPTLADADALGAYLAKVPADDPLAVDAVTAGGPPEPVVATIGLYHPVAGEAVFECGGPEMAPALPQSADNRTLDAQTRLFHEPPAQFTTANFGNVIGQLQDTFVVSATDDEIFFLDQHVAHERVLFERLLADLDAGPLASQELLFPQPLELGAGQAALVQEWTETLEGLGFRLEGWSGSTVVLRAVPALLRGQEPRRLIEALVEDVNRPRKGEPQPLLHRALSFVACHAAIKAHAPLQREEMARLIADLAVTKTPYFCPHGRPIVSRLSLRDIKRELGRTW